MTLTQFAEQFAGRVLRKTFQRAVTPVITNRNYEGDIKKPGDRVNILSFPNGILMSDYVVGSDMNSETIVDMEDQLVVEKRRYYNFSLDSVEKVFTYGQDIPDVLLDKASETLEREIDEYVLGKYIGAKAGSWIGVNLVVAGSGQTMASIVTTATGGTVTISGYSQANAQEIGAVENPVDGSLYFGGFHASDIGKGFRLRSTSTFVSPWYRISDVTSSVVASLTEWDGATSGSDFSEGYTLRGVFGGDGVNFPKNGDGVNSSLLTQAGLGWEIQAAIATTVTAATIYDAVTELYEAFSREEVPTDSLNLVVPPSMVTMLKQATELQPTGIAEVYTGTVLNGKVGRLGGFQILQAAGSRISTRAGHPTATGALAPDTVVTAGTTGYNILASTTEAITFADKWSESRVVDAENQFAKKYQGLYLYGALMPAVRRRNAAILFAGL